MVVRPIAKLLFNARVGHYKTKTFKKGHILKLSVNHKKSIEEGVRSLPYPLFLTKQIACAEIIMKFKTLRMVYLRMFILITEYKYVG